MNLLLVLPLLFMLLSNFVIMARLLRQKTKEKVQTLIILCVALSFYLLGYLLEVTAPTLEAVELAYIVCNMGIPSIAPFTLILVIQLCDYKFYGRWMYIAAATNSFILFIIVFFNRYHHLFYTGFDIHFGSWTQVSAGHGPIYLYNQAIALLCGIASYILLGRRFFQWSRRMKRQMALITLAAAVTFIGNLLNVAGLIPYRLDSTPFAYFVIILFYAVTLIKNKVYDLVPLATERAIVSMDDAFIILDQDGFYLYSNEAALRIFPSLKSIPISTSISKVKNWPFPEGALVPGQSTFQLTAQNDTRVYRSNVSTVNNGDEILGWSVVIRDTTETSRLLETLERLALTDSLTGIYNRRYFEELAEREISMAQRTGSVCSLIMFDLDHFKRVNDTYGHLAGDKVLATISFVIHSKLRPGDIFARYGGEEFVILAPNTDIRGAVAFAHRLRHVIADTPVAYEENIIMMKASFGVSEWVPEASLQELVAAADNAMYAAKSSGRNRVKFKPVERSNKPHN